LRAYDRVDVALDSFPFPAGTTSVEALWMGVPTLTRRGRRFIGHNGETIALNAGQSAWIAEDDDDYVRKAVELTSDLSALATLRAGLRAQVLASPLFNGPRFARHFEAAMTTLWLTRPSASAPRPPSAPPR
jgi:predicted O-linked N-acetylglucosamine transferase (SPINDLY family)